MGFLVNGLVWLLGLIVVIGGGWIINDKIISPSQEENNFNPKEELSFNTNKETKYLNTDSKKRLNKINLDIAKVQKELLEKYKKYFSLRREILDKVSSSYSCVEDSSFLKKEILEFNKIKNLNKKNLKIKNKKELIEIDEKSEIEKVPSLEEPSEKNNLKEEEDVVEIEEPIKEKDVKIGF